MVIVVILVYVNSLSILFYINYSTHNLEMDYVVHSIFLWTRRDLCRTYTTHTAMHTDLHIFNTDSVFTGQTYALHPIICIIDIIS